MDELVDRALKVAANKDRVLITLVGIPGSGKTTAAKQVADQLNARGVSCVVVGMDGYHYTRKDLAKRIGEEKARKFRGAPYTFDAPALVQLAQQLATNSTSDIYFPTFDHAIKDPTENGGKVPANTRVVILEGLYLHLQDPEWLGIMEAASDTWFIDTDVAVARERLANRHLVSGIVDSIEAGYERADSNDLVNGEYIRSNSHRASHIF